MDLFLQSIVKMSYKAPFPKVTIKAPEKSQSFLLMFFIMKLSKHLQIWIALYEGVF